MIDTVKCKVFLDNELRDAITSQAREKKDIQHSPYETNDDEMDLDSFSDDYDDSEELDEWKNRFLYNNIRVFFKNCVIKAQIIRGNLFLEFSAPKVMYGSNIYMLYPQQIDEVLQTVKKHVEGYYNVVLPNTDKWILQRLDICYAWRLPTEEDTKSLIAVLSSYEFPRKKKTIIADESVTFWGTTCKVKFYRKKPEYKAHSFKRPRKGTYAYANATNLLEACTGILRFEVTMFKKQLETIFGEKHVNCDVINYVNIESLLIKFLSQLVKTDNFEIIDVKETYSKLESAYDKSKALNLLQFLNMWFCDNKEQERHNRLLLDSQYRTSTISNKLKAITESDIGIIDTSGKCTKFDLSIPSKLATNTPSHNVLELLPKIEKPEPRLGGVKI